MDNELASAETKIRLDDLASARNSKLLSPDDVKSTKYVVAEETIEL